MRMTVQEALTIMQLQGQVVTRELVKTTYRKLASKYHPDKNPNGLRHMQDVNVAYEYLSKLPDVSLSGGYQKQKARYEEPKEPPEFRMFRMFGLLISKDDYELKVWVSGKTFPYKEHLKQYGFRWCPKQRAWWRMSI